jgi:hypothetical protein
MLVKSTQLFHRLKVKESGDSGAHGITTTSADRDCCYVWQTNDCQAFRVSWTASSQSAVCSAKGWGTDVKCSVETSVVDNAWLKANATVSFKEPNVFHFSFWNE